MQHTRKRNKPPKAKWIADKDSALEKLPERNISKKKTPINFYCDEIGFPLDHKHCLSRWCYQHVLNLTGTLDEYHFTKNPLIDHIALLNLDREVNVKLFEEGISSTGSNIIVIGLMGGWTTYKLDAITKWLTNSSRKSFWNNEDCQIVLDYSQEGFDEYFGSIHNWVNEHSLHNRVTVVSGSYNCKKVLTNWEHMVSRQNNFNIVWYGFFAEWISNRVESTPEPVNYIAGNKRLMCLNRRPHPHRMILASMLERESLIDKIEISFPKNMSEDGPYATAGHDNVRLFWDRCVDYQNGFIDHLVEPFNSLFKKLPLIADTSDFATNHATDFNVDLYKNFPINIVTETLFFTQNVFPSEKLWKPMAQGQVFLVMGAKDFLPSLRSMGFKTFSPFINEEYDTIVDHLERAEVLVQEIKRLAELPEKEFKNIIDNCREAIKHNQELILNNSKVKRLTSKNITDCLESI